MKKLSFAFAAWILLVFSTFVNGGLLVSDSFESGDMTTQNDIGFRWDNTPKTSIVTSTTEVYKTSKLNKPAPQNSQWVARTGMHALLFRYIEGEPWTEQRFKFDQPQPELWMSFWLRVPTNYAHPNVEGASDNQKLFRLWMDKYGTDRDGQKVGMEFRSAGGGSSYFYGKIGSGSDIGRVRFITVPDDRGKWMHLVVHVDSESSPGAKDGLMEVWRKWEGERGYTKTHDFKDRAINLGSEIKGFSKGYLMGWANAHYPVETDFLIDDFELSTMPLFSTSAAPTSPTQFTIK